MVAVGVPPSNPCGYGQKYLVIAPLGSKTLSDKLSCDLRHLSSGVEHIHGKVGVVSQCFRGQIVKVLLSNLVFIIHHIVNVSRTIMLRLYGAPYKPCAYLRPRRANILL